VSPCAWLGDLSALLRREIFNNARRRSSVGRCRMSPGYTGTAETRSFRVEPVISTPAHATSASRRPSAKLGKPTRCVKSCKKWAAPGVSPSPPHQHLANSTTRRELPADLLNLQGRHRWHPRYMPARFDDDEHRFCSRVHARARRIGPVFQSGFCCVFAMLCAVADVIIPTLDVMSVQGLQVPAPRGERIEPLTSDRLRVKRRQALLLEQPPAP